VEKKRSQNLGPRRAKTKTGTERRKKVYPKRGVFGVRRKALRRGREHLEERISGGGGTSKEGNNEEERLLAIPHGLRKIRSQKREGTSKTRNPYAKLAENKW